VIVQLTPSWILTDEHSASSYGQPVLVGMATGEAYGPGDIIRAYPSWSFAPASMAVERMTKTTRLAEDEGFFVDRFINFGK